MCLVGHMGLWDEAACLVSVDWPHPWEKPACHHLPHATQWGLLCSRPGACLQLRLRGQVRLVPWLEAVGASIPEERTQGESCQWRSPAPCSRAHSAGSLSSAAGQRQKSVCAPPSQGGGHTPCRGAQQRQHSAQIWSESRRHRGGSLGVGTAGLPARLAV